MTRTPWEPGPARPRLVAATVDVWCADLDEPAVRAAAHDVLDADERARAARFAQPEAGARWAAARGVLRVLLAAHLDADPAAARLERGPHGKPRLAGEARLRFNLSHSRGVALYALALDREVGVDVELPRRAVDHVAIARRAFGDAEAERLAALEPPARERAFLRAWVRWEAALKCRGSGIGGAEVPAEGPQPWIRELELDGPGAAALAVAVGPVEVRCRRWSPAA